MKIVILMYVVLFVIIIFIDYVIIFDDFCIYGIIIDFFLKIGWKINGVLVFVFG